METPTSFLPSLKRLDEYTAPQLHTILTRLVSLYLPAVRGTAPIDEDLESLQADTFERSFTIRWLTGFIARGEEWVESYTQDSEQDTNPTANSTSSIGRFQTEFSHDTHQARATALDRAAALLGACAGTSASGAISREFKFSTSDESEITVTLRDESLSVGDHTAVGLQTWGSACILAERIARDPPSFGLPAPLDAPSSNLQENRILELGAGTGLLSLLFGKIVQNSKAAQAHTIIATDYHPAVLDNLRTNIQVNFETATDENPSEPPIQVHPVDWSLYLTGKPTTNLSRAPSTVVTPAIGTPISSGEDYKVLAPLPPGGPTPLTSSVSSVSSAPSLSSNSTSALSTPATPRTPHTPRTVRSPPPNLARAVFSRLVARGEKFEMPGTDLIGEQTKGPDREDQIKSLGEEVENSVNSKLVSALPKTTTNFKLKDLDLHQLAPSDHGNSDPMPNVSCVLPTSDETYPQPTALLCVDINQNSVIDTPREGLVPDSSPPASPNKTNCSCLDNTPQLSPLVYANATSNTCPDNRLAPPRCLDISNKVAALDDLDNADGTQVVYSPVARRSTDGSPAPDAINHGRVENSVGPGAAPNSSGNLTMSAASTSAILERDTGSIQATSPAVQETLGQGETCSESVPEIGGCLIQPSARLTNLTHEGNNVFLNHIPMGARDCYKPNSIAPNDPPFDRPFDTIFGADIVYELSHVNLVRGVVERLLRKPSYAPSAPPAYFHLIMPLRPTHADEARSVDMAFPQAEDVRAQRMGEEEVLAIVATETYARSAGVGRADEVQYVHYRVGWV